MADFKRILRDLERQKAAAEAELEKINRAITALSEVAGAGRRRGRRPGRKMNAATRAKMKAAQQKRRAAEKKEKKAAPKPKAKAAAAKQEQGTQE